MKIGEAKPDNMNAVHPCAEGFEGVCPIFFGQAATRQILQSRKSGQCLFSIQHLKASRGLAPAFGQRPLTLHSREKWDAPALKPALDMPSQTCGIIGTQQIEDCSLDHPAAGQAATRLARCKPCPPQRDPSGPQRRPRAQFWLREAKARRHRSTPAQLGIC